MIVLHPEFPVAVWITCEPALGDEELEHRAQRADRLEDLARVGERVRGTEEAALATDKTDDGASVWRERPFAKTALPARDHEALIDPARVEECEAKRACLCFFLVQLGHTASLATARPIGLKRDRRARALVEQHGETQICP
jgi:hypothetical protein